MSEGGPKMLRMVRWQGVMQDAERLRNWHDADATEALARTLHMGDPRTAKNAILSWADSELFKLESNPRSVPYDYAKLESVYMEMLSKVDGRLAVMDTELGYHSQNVGPEFDRAHYEYPSWCNTANLRHLFSEGREVTVTGHMGTGKSHLAVSFMEYQLTLLERPKVHIVTNISGIKDTSNRFHDRIHHVSLLSEVLRIWTRLPPGSLICLVIDEPETNLRGGSTKSVRMFSDFRHMLRKLGMSKLEIWHTESEQYKALREQEGENVTRIVKTEKESFEVHRTLRKEGFKQLVEGVHELRFLNYAHRGMASIDVDVNMNRLIRFISKLHRVGEMKTAIQLALGDSSFYLADFQPEDGSAGQVDEWEKVIECVLRDPTRYLTQKRFINRVLLCEEFALSDRAARRVAAEATRRWRGQTPNWRNIELPELLRKNDEGVGESHSTRPKRLKNADDRDVRGESDESE